MAGIAYVQANKVINGQSVPFIAPGSVQGDGYVYFNDNMFYRCHVDGTNLQVFYSKQARWIHSGILTDIRISNVNLDSVVGGGGAVAPNGDVEAFVKWCEDIAADDSHGYDQTYRDGPDYDCASLIMHGLNSAMGIPMLPAYNVRGLWNGLPEYGWVQHGSEANSASNLVRGDILIAYGAHTALYIGNNRVVQASINEFGDITGGQTGDQTGQEIAAGPFYSFPWTGFLRYGS